MPIDNVVINASPLIILFKARMEDLIPKLFHNIYVPQAVISEVADVDYEDEPVSGIIDAGWAKQAFIDFIPTDISSWDLGAGESEVLTFAFKNPGFHAIIDDKAARRCAKTIGVKTLGTGGLLILAKRRGLIKTVASGLDKLRQSGLWLSDELRNLLLKEAGEKQ
jgi:predicted nucleic acid-binding protein